MSQHAAACTVRSIKDFDKEGWKKRQLFTEYYTANLHVGAFMLPKYVEDILEEEEGKK